VRAGADLCVGGGVPEGEHPATFEALGKLSFIVGQRGGVNGQAVHDHLEPQTEAGPRRRLHGVHVPGEAQGPLAGHAHAGHRSTVRVV